MTVTLLLEADAESEGPSGFSVQEAEADDVLGFSSLRSTSSNLRKVIIVILDRRLWK